MLPNSSAAAALTASCWRRDFHHGVDERSATALFRILQGSPANVLRHAQARRVEVGLDRDAIRFRMRIADDGAGMRREHARTPRTFGLQRIRERPRMLDPSLQVNGIRNQGAALRITIPAGIGPKVKSS